MSLIFHELISKWGEAGRKQTTLYKASNKNVKIVLQKIQHTPLKTEEDEGEINSNWSIQRRANK